MMNHPRMAPLALLLTVATACVSGPGAVATVATGPAAVASDAPQPIDLLLDHFHIESIVVPRGRAFTRQAALLIGDLSDEIGRAHV